MTCFDHLQYSLLLLCLIANLINLLEQCEILQQTIFHYRLMNICIPSVDCSITKMLLLLPNYGSVILCCHKEYHSGGTAHTTAYCNNVNIQVSFSPIVYHDHLLIDRDNQASYSMQIVRLSFCYIILVRKRRDVNDTV